MKNIDCIKNLHIRNCLKVFEYSVYRQHAECNIDPENTLSQYKSFVWIVNIGSTKQITPDQTSSIIHFDSRSFTQIQDCLL